MLRQTIGTLVSAVVIIISLMNLAAHAQSFPTRAISIIVGPVGSGPDFVARLLAASLSSMHNVPVVVLNRPAGGGIEAVLAGLEAPPDGYTLVMTTSKVVLAIKEQQGGKRELKHFADLSPIAQFIDPSLLVVRKGAPWADLTAFLNAAFSRSGGVRLGHATLSAASYMTAYLLIGQLGIPHSAVRFETELDVVKALNDGAIDAAFLPYAMIGSYVRSADLRALAVSTPGRFAALPDVSSFVELGYEHVKFVGWTGLFVPPGVPEQNTAILRGLISRVVKSVEFEMAIQKAGYVTTDSAEYMFLRNPDPPRREPQVHLVPPNVRFVCNSALKVYVNQRCDKKCCESSCRELCQALKGGLSKENCPIDVAASCK